MTQDEAKLVALLIGFADSACVNCVQGLVKHANRLFPEYKWQASEEYAFHKYKINDHETYDRYVPVTVKRRS
jgi:hypothetical protein